MRAALDKTRPFCLLLTAFVLAPTTGCGKDGAAEQRADVSPQAQARAETIFSNRCASCHGERGQGDGPASSGLDPKPRDFTNDSWQQEVSDKHIEQIIQYGGAAVGKSAAMPANPDLQSKPEVVSALRHHIRELDD